MYSVVGAGSNMKILYQLDSYSGSIVNPTYTHKHIQKHVYKVNRQAEMLSKYWSDGDR